MDVETRGLGERVQAGDADCGFEDAGITIFENKETGGHETIKQSLTVGGD